MVPQLSSRILGSPDIYQNPDFGPDRSINFITCHDGFTLNDLVSYNEKHNEANGEQNRDGSDYNHSWNCGIEGPTNDPQIEVLRLRQIKNLLTLLFMSQGTPMLLMGDEVRRTQRGNNNAYCQDNELSWFDWERVPKQAELLRFVQQLIRLTQPLKIFSQQGLLEVTYGSQKPHLIWHGVKLGLPDWSWESRSLAFTLRHPAADEHLYVILNAYWKPLTFELPLLLQTEHWYRIVDTALPTPDDICQPAIAPIVVGSSYRAEGRSAVVLIER
jgi:glycogen operon protein